MDEEKEQVEGLIKQAENAGKQWEEVDKIEAEQKQREEEKTWISKNQKLDLLLSSGYANLLMIWLAATMATIAAINTIIEPFVFRILVFLVVSGLSLGLYKKLVVK